MKHKAQGSLDHLVMVSCPKQVSCKECSINSRCNSIAKDYVDDVQRVIDCQLTIDQINVMYLWACQAYVNNQISEDEESTDIFSDLKEKLLKQKEMWEEERCQ